MQRRTGLSRLRVLDLSMGWAGPFVSFLLAELGAEVIKVEACQHFDWWRGPHPRDAARNPDGSINQTAHEQAPVYNSVNRHKLGLTLDLTTVAGKAALHNLVRVSDLLVENFTPHAMASLSLDYPALARINPHLIMLSMPAFGSTGPERDYIGYGMTIEATAGMTALTGYEDGPPQMMGNAYGDPVSGLNGAAAALIALHRRDQTGTGAHIEVAQVEGFIPLIAGALLDRQMNGRDGRRTGNRHPSMAPHGVYPCGPALTPGPSPAERERGASAGTGSTVSPLSRAAGEGPGVRADSWIAIAIQSDAEWSLLCTILNRPDLVDDPRFADVVSRKRNENQIDPIIAGWTMQHERDEAVGLLRAAGVPVAPVQTSADLLADAGLAARAFFTVVDRAHVGAHPYPGLPFSLIPPPEIDPRPAPCLGEHNELVLCDLLGMGEPQYEALLEAGVTGTEPADR
ncbi:MAG: CaiB/BaiF CoA transferase family protein [Dehalococcoidia bacterium]